MAGCAAGSIFAQVSFFKRQGLYFFDLLTGKSGHFHAFSEPVNPASAFF
jgi:hypothetical protein